MAVWTRQASTRNAFNYLKYFKNQALDLANDYSTYSFINN